MRRWLLIPPVASLFLVSGYESWWALNKAAVAAKIPDPRPWPWAVDGFILVMALMVVFAAIDGHSWGTWWPRLGLLGATALSTGIQAAWAPGIQAAWAPEQDWAWALHAWSPLAVLSSFECLVWLVFGQAPARPKPERASGPPLPARAHAWLRSWELPEEVPATRYGPPAGSPGHPSAQPGIVQLDQRRPSTRPSRDGFTPAQHRQVERWVLERRSASWMAQELGLSDRARKTKLGPLVRELKAAAAQVGPSPNGDGGS